jgi:hypothetical protein
MTKAVKMHHTLDGGSETPFGEWAPHAEGDE